MIHSQSYYPVRTDVLQQALSKWFIPNPITQLELMFYNKRLVNDSFPILLPS